MLSEGTTPGGSRFLHRGHTERSLQDPTQAADPGHSSPGTAPAEIPQVQARKTLAIKAKKSCPCLMAPRCTPARCLLCCRAGSGQKSLPHTSQHHTLCSPLLCHGPHAQLTSWKEPTFLWKNFTPLCASLEEQVHLLPAKKSKCTLQISACN